jgi:hypothetical protein
MRCTVPTRLSLMRRTLASMRGLHLLQAPQLDLLRRVVGQVGGGRARPGAEDEAEAGVEAHVLDQLHRLAKSSSVSPGKPTMKSAGQADVRAHGAQLADRALVFHARCSRASSAIRMRSLPCCTGRCRWLTSLGTGVGLDQPLA